MKTKYQWLLNAKLHLFLSAFKAEKSVGIENLYCLFAPKEKPFQREAIGAADLIFTKKIYFFPTSFLSGALE